MSQRGRSRRSGRRAHVVVDSFWEGNPEAAQSWEAVTDLRTAAAAEGRGLTPEGFAKVRGRFRSVNPDVTDERVVALFQIWSAQAVGVRPRNIPEWVSAGVFVFERPYVTPQWNQWRQLVVVRCTGMGWDYAAYAACAGYSPAEAEAAWRDGLVSLSDMELLAALR